MSWPEAGLRGGPGGYESGLSPSGSRCGGGEPGNDRATSTLFVL